MNRHLQIGGGFSGLTCSNCGNSRKNLGIVSVYANKGSWETLSSTSYYTDVWCTNCGQLGTIKKYILYTGTGSGYRYYSCPVCYKVYAKGSHSSGSIGAWFKCSHGLVIDCIDPIPDYGIAYSDNF